MTYVIPGTNSTWICSAIRYRNGRAVFFGYDDAEFCAEAWERQTSGGVGAGLPRRATHGDLAFGDLVASPVRDRRGYEWSLQIRERGA